MLSAQLSDYLLSQIDAYLRGANYATPFMGLFTNNPALDASMQIATFTEPVYTTYARTAMTLEAIAKNAAGDYLEKFSSVTFQPTADPATPQTCNGYFVKETAGATEDILSAEYFIDVNGNPNPFTFTTLFDALDLQYMGMTRNLKTYGGLCASC